MQRKDTTGRRVEVEYILPAHRLVGTQAEVLTRLEEIIQGLVGLQLAMQRDLVEERPATVRAVRPALRLVACGGAGRRSPELG